MKLTPTYLRKWRLKHKLTTERMADMMGVCDRYYRYRESGEKEIDTEFSNNFNWVRITFDKG